MINVSTFTPVYHKEKNHGFFDNISRRVNDYFSKKKGIVFAQKCGFESQLKEIRIPEMVRLSFYQFTLDKYMRMENSMMMIMNERATDNSMQSTLRMLMSLTATAFPALSLSQFVSKAPINPTKSVNIRTTPNRVVNFIWQLTILTTICQKYRLNKKQINLISVTYLK